MEVLDSEYCADCGNLRYLCHNETDDIRFKIEDDHCFALEAVERRQARDAENKVDTKGVRLRPRPVSVSGKPFIEYREQYYTELRKKREEIAALEAATRVA